ncbi:Rad3-related DNA helicase [Paucimonas lemoignei]|uniref:Rad3-related DNA helicase n=1 Tax=Paucimonas lemoignei TaxID=29443 RepID=A0A4R3I3D0_PAULE|nr:ATP-dependent DNA helicase [Paucimonas lemoignei]TCS39321.1 Rad3-related DNA helicase [Paucimonas lemoignei]
MSYVVAVRELCAFTAKQGDLDLRFSPSPTALEGIIGHQTVQSRRPAGYEAEISLSGEYEDLRVRGRADGYDPAKHQLEEIKTFRGDLDLMPENHRVLHWAQLKMYGYLLCEQRRFDSLKLALVYYDVGRQKETLLVEEHERDALKAFFEEQCRRFLAWARQELAHRSMRDEILAALPFPYPAFREGQRQLAEAVYKSAGAHRPLLAQAPTGIGKSVGTLFPMLKACAHKKLDKVFFLTAKTPGRQVALDALRTIQGDHPSSLRVLELVARDKACEHPDKACHGQSCPLAQGFYDRLPPARAEAVTAGGDRESIRSIALKHDICPYYLSQDLARWADVVVADYNYYFDSSALLYALTVENDWQIGVLVDEAHNLISRARDMYSATLNQTLLKANRNSAPKVIKKEFDGVHRAWNELNQSQSGTYSAYPEVPASFDGAIRRLLSAMTEYVAESPDAFDQPMQTFYFEALQFSRLADTFGDHSLFDLNKTEDQGGRSTSSLCIRNVMPAPHLADRLARPACMVLFSATLSPWHYYSDILGLKDPLWIDVDSPFQAAQLRVHIAKSISTRYRDRTASADKIVELMRRQYLDSPGNYLAFFSSFDYLEQVLACMESLQTRIPLWRQSSRMSEAEKHAFLANFQPGGQGIGFAVLGGAFGEGIDLPGDRLIGAFIATLGLPQINPVNEEMKRRMDAILGNGYDYIYQYPGLQKVVQAAGRVIRTSSDKGTVHLMDDRFDRSEIRELLPRWWRV